MAAKSYRWFRFSLRTMFVVMTAICCYLGWEISIVRQRQAMLRELRNQPYVQITTADAWKEHLLAGGWKGDQPAKVPVVRVWLGDEAIQAIACGTGHHHLSHDQFTRLPKVFPEARVSEYEVLAIPCHPGCFPLGTLVESPRGPRLIEEIRVGDELMALSSEGRQFVAVVQSVFVTNNRLWKVETDDGSLLTTQAQPLCLTIDRPIRAGDLKPRDKVLRFVDGKLRPVTVLAAFPTGRLETVFNVVLGGSQHFVAGGFVARSKPPAE